MTTSQEPPMDSEQDQWPVEDPGPEEPSEGRDPEQPETVDVRETGDRDDPMPSGREGLAGRS